MLGQGPAWIFFGYVREGGRRRLVPRSKAAELWGRPPLVTDSGVRHSRNLYSATKAASNLWKQPLVESVRWDLFRKWGVKVRRTSVLDAFQVKHTSLPRGEENCVSLEFDPPATDRPSFPKRQMPISGGGGGGGGRGKFKWKVGCCNQSQARF